MKKALFIHLLFCKLWLGKCNTSLKFNSIVPIKKMKNYQKCPRCSERAFLSWANVKQVVKSQKILEWIGVFYNFYVYLSREN